jgi:protocatechuate 3,4-dioxygenase beta subunit
MTDGSAAPPTELDDDDRLIGRVLTRREVLALLGAGGVALVAAACIPAGTSSPPTSAAATPAASAGTSAGASAGTSPSASAIAGIPACVVVPELTEGPYYIDTDLERSDVRPDTTTGNAVEGVPLDLSFVVSALESGACAPIEGAVVDVWHCDALGVYSGVSGNTGNFLRGVQRTDANGVASFRTVYPGWYQGRAVHIHFKVRTDPDAASGHELTSQLFFDDDLSRRIFTTTDPYSSKGAQDMPNERDGIFRQSDGTTLLDAESSGGGFAARFPIAIQRA